MTFLIFSGRSFQFEKSTLNVSPDSSNASRNCADSCRFKDSPTTARSRSEYSFAVPFTLEPNAITCLSVKTLDRIFLSSFKSFSVMSIIPAPEILEKPFRFALEFYRGGKDLFCGGFVIGMARAVPRLVEYHPAVYIVDQAGFARHAE